MKIACFGDSLTHGVPGSSYFAVLQEQFPEDTLLNYGKGNDTVVSLYRRISALRFDQPLDIAFLWVGVNDVPQTDGRPQRAFHTLIGQPRARDSEQFHRCYRATLELLCDQTGRVIVHDFSNLLLGRGAARQKELAVRAARLTAMFRMCS